MRCPSCDSNELLVFYEQLKVPVHSVLLIPTREEALAYPKGDIALGLCQACGFIANIRFNPQLLDYSASYESTQSFSSTFGAYHQDLAERLIKKYDLYHKEIIEIGCGQGEFLRLLCKLGENRGIGFDPAVNGLQLQDSSEENITFIKDFYSREYSNYSCDFICCKMTLEHINEPAKLLRLVHESMKSQLGTLVFFQVPDVTRILDEMAFWDIYYEHCSYFSPESLVRLFQGCGFQIVDLEKDYADQYISITARVTNTNRFFLEDNKGLDSLIQKVNNFSSNYHQKVDQWREKLHPILKKGYKCVIWGASSKSVAFFSTLDIQEEIEFAVDINPNKHETYIAGTGQKIVAPEFLKEYKPDVVIGMNSVYRDEIQETLNKMDVRAQLIFV